MGHKTSKEVADPKVLQKSSRDIRLLVPDDAGKIHTVVVPKAILLEHSALFREMAQSGKQKKLKKLKLQDVHVIGVLRSMQYIENGTVTFDNVSEVAETLKTAEKYKIETVEDVCIDYLNTTLNANNVCEIYELCVKKEFSDVIYKCLKLFDSDSEAVLNSDSFLKLDIHSVQDIIKRSSLNVSSEMIIFNAVMKWGEAELCRKGLNPENVIDLKHVVNPLLIHVHFQAMSVEELESPQITELQDCLHQLKLSPHGDSNHRSNQIVQHRSHVDNYIHHLEVFESPQHSISNGENFSLTIEVLKGRIYLCGVTLALRQFSARMNASCLYAMLCGTNPRTSEQKRIRGTFLNVDDEASLMFSSPLFAKDNDQLELQLNVKMAGNVCPLTRENNIEIIVPDSKDIAMKILAQNCCHNNISCIFKDFIYFF